MACNLQNATQAALDKHGITRQEGQQEAARVAVGGAGNAVDVDLVAGGEEGTEEGDAERKEDIATTNTGTTRNKRKARTSTPAAPAAAAPNNKSKRARK